jgi:hypothetical protein
MNGDCKEFLINFLYLCKNFHYTILNLRISYLVSLLRTHPPLESHAMWPLENCRMNLIPRHIIG